MLAASGCYDPTPPAGVPCGDNDVCPAGQTCIAGICEGSMDADVVPDALSTDAPLGCEAWQAKHFTPCALPAPMGDLQMIESMSTYNWDTSSGVLKAKAGKVVPVATMIVQQTGGPELLVASVNNLTIDPQVTLSIAGSRPLVFAVWGTAKIGGTIDGAASYSVPGPGGVSSTSTPYGCGSGPTGDSGASGTPATGGGGGGYQGVGGRGGNTGGLGGDALMPSLIIHGGCAGGSGGVGTSTAGTRGAGGGALQITAPTSIEITTGAVIHMGGGGGSYGRAGYGGGGGGGTGGYIGLDAPQVTIAGTLAANGGGGGGGASDVANGSSGGNARADGVAATGGAGATSTNVGACGRGGSGGAGGTLGGATGGSSGCGGAGGGGAVGYILVWSPALMVTGTVSPPAMSGP